MRKKLFFFAIPSSQRETFRVFLLSPLTEGRLSQTPVEELQREKGKKAFICPHSFSFLPRWGGGNLKGERKFFACNPFFCVFGKRK